MIVELTPDTINHRGVVAVPMGVHAADDTNRRRCHAGHALPLLFAAVRSDTLRSGSVDKPVMGAFAQAPIRSRRPAVRVHPTPPIRPTDRPKDSNQRVRLTESQTRRETPHPSSLAYDQVWVASCS